jgi:chromate transporter
VRDDVEPPRNGHTLSEMALIFLRLGVTAFGGPAAHIAMMRAEFVERKQWISEADYLDLIGASNLLPGPSSTEVAIFLGLRFGGLAGLALAGMCFILPAMLIVMALSSAYVTYGHFPQVGRLLYGIKPVIIAIIALAVWNLGRSALKSSASLVLAIVDLAFCFFGFPSVLLLFLSGLATTVQHRLSDKSNQVGRSERMVMGSILAVFIFPMLVSFLNILKLHNLSILSLFLEFVKLGSMVFGSGYVLLAFLRNELITDLHWLTANQLLDAVAVGQFTPGPVFTTATFIGYILKGPTGALAATAGIFLPAFLFVAAAGRFVRKIRSSKTASAFLDGVNAAAIALMTFAGLQLAVAAIVDIFTATIALVSAWVLLKYKTNSSWLVLAGAALGLIIRSFRFAR